MSLSVYLRFLRPLRSLFVVACFTYAAWAYSGPMGLHLDPVIAKFMAVSVALPLLLGIFIAGAVHEPMHQPFALTLPNIRSRQRMAAAVSWLVAGLVVMCTSTWTSPTVAPIATFGLACGLSALPCLDRRQHLVGTAASWAAFLIYLLTCIVFGTKLVVAMNAAPWLFLLAGLALGSAVLAQGFSHSSLRIRANTLFQSHQTLFCSYTLFDLPMVVSRQAELSAQKSRRKKAHVSTSADWEVRSVGASSLDWIRVFWHANFGVNKRSFIRAQLRFATTLLIYATILSGIACIFDQKKYWESLALMAAPGTKMGEMIGPVAIMLQPGIAALCMLAVFTPKLAYPISRARLASAVFWQTGAQWAVALVLPATAIFLVSFLGQIVSGKFLPGYGLPALLNVDLLLGALLPLLVAAGTVRGSILRIITAVPIVGTIMLVAVASSNLQQYVFSWPGLGFLLLATAASQWLLWHRLHRNYATADLPVEFGLSYSGAFGLLTPP